MLIKEFSKRTGLSIHTLRFYENYGLFKGFSDETIKSNNYKHYDESLLQKIEIIKGAKEAGFTLSEIKKLLDNWFNKRISIKSKVEIVSDKINQIEDRIIQLKQVKNILIEAINDIRNGHC
ncbi:MerR family transcriptional regulator [Pedobacter arcticus]|uniref:MerR family transcriptional regulator n=1 Tax=Pedobacter arcticus TaxID=752140 RepID=UPI0002F0AA69|nr:MerR family transcriptional regulator [Pedobacter arcticus]